MWWLWRLWRAFWIPDHLNTGHICDLDTGLVCYSDPLFWSCDDCDIREEHPEYQTIWIPDLDTGLVCYSDPLFGSCDDCNIRDHLNTGHIRDLDTGLARYSDPICELLSQSESYFQEQVELSNFSKQWWCFKYKTVRQCISTVRWRQFHAENFEVK